MDTMHAHLMILALNNLARAIVSKEVPRPSHEIPHPIGVIRVADDLDKQAKQYLDNLHSSEMGD